jgi:hypothetical protein
VSYLAENALPIWMGGAVLLTLALIVYAQLRGTAALIGVLAVVLVTALLLVVEWLIVTPREAVERELYGLAAAIEANDVPGVLAHIAPGATRVRSDAETQMPLVRIEKARVVNSPQIDLNQPDDPTEAVVRFRALVDAAVKRNGMRGAGMDDLTVTFVREGDRWLVESYTSARNWRRAAGL